MLSPPARRVRVILHAAETKCHGTPLAVHSDGLLMIRQTKMSPMKTDKN